MGFFNGLVCDFGFWFLLLLLFLNFVLCSLSLFLFWFGFGWVFLVVGFCFWVFLVHTEIPARERVAYIVIFSKSTDTQSKKSANEILKEKNLNISHSTFYF